MISLKQELQNYSAINLKSLAENDSDIPDNIKNSIILYNKSLESIRIDSEDIAIIELKKAIAMNPGFHEAMNLLGLCYSYTKEYAKAAEIFEKVVLAENNSIKALRYLSLMNSDDHVVSALESKSKTQKKDAAHHGGGSKSFFADFLNFKDNWKVDLKKYLAGIALGALVVLLIGFFAYTPANEAVDAMSNRDNTAGGTTVDQGETLPDNSQSKAGMDNLQSSLDAANAQVNYYKNALKLIDVQDLIKKKQYEDAADLLTLLKSASFTGPEQERYNNMYDDAIPKAAVALVNSAGKLMNSKKYSDALDKLSKIRIYGSDKVNLELVLYWTGKCYTSLNDSKNAVQAFQELVNTYPKGKYTRFAEKRIKDLTGTP